MPSDFPAIPLNQKTEKNVKLFLDGLAGRMGIGGRAVTFNDLVDAGMVTLKPGVTLGDIQGGVDPGDVIDVPTTELPDKPTTPFDLATASSWGAIFLTWEYEAYNDEYGTEIWRSIVNDRDTANLIAVGDGRAYTDNVGEKQTYYYWVRNRSIGNLIGGYNQLIGVQGDSNLKTTAADFAMAHPDTDTVFVPFTIEDFGPVGGPPDWKILINGQVIIQGDLGIGQLTTGEMRPNTDFTIGNGSMQLGTDSNGKGFMIVTGDGGIAGNDYLYLNAGVLETWIWDPNIGEHVKYKELRRIERGVTTNGTATIIPPYFKSEPTVSLSFESISVYNPDFGSQAQSLKMSAGPVLPVTGVDGSYTFTPTAVLALSDGFKVSVENLTAQTTGDTGATLTSAIIHNNGQGFESTFTVSSAKNADASNFQNRQVLITMQGSLNGGAYSSLASLNVLLTGDGVAKQVTIDSGPQIQGTWTLRYVFAPSDRSGTTPSGGASYIYTSEQVNSGNNLSLVNNPSNNTVTGLPQVAAPNIPVNGQLYEIDYAVDYNAQGEAWKLCYEGCYESFPKIKVGEARALVTGKNTLTVNAGTGDAAIAVVGLCNTYPSIGEVSYNTNSVSGTAGTGGRIAITPNSEPYISGRYTNTVWQSQGESIASQVVGAGGCQVGYAKGTINITAYRVTYYYRVPVTVNLTAVNNFKVDSVSADLGATDISIDDAVINWIAFGE